ncbi:hypothetical protein ACN47E_006581 [Coniothyrium glycines]
MTTDASASAFATGLLACLLRSPQPIGWKTHFSHCPFTFNTLPGNSPDSVVSAVAAGTVYTCRYSQVGPWRGGPLRLACRAYGPLFGGACEPEPQLRAERCECVGQQASAPV